MITTFIVNGKTQLCLTPSDDKEKALLIDLFSKSVTIMAGETVQILNKNHPDSFIIAPAEKPAEDQGTINR